MDDDDDDAVIPLCFRLCLTVFVPLCLQVHTLEVFQKGLNDSEHLVFQALHSLQRALQGNYKDVVNMRESSRQRLEALRDAAIKVIHLSGYLSVHPIV